MSGPSDAFSCRIASGSKSRSIRVLALDTAVSVLEYTILSAARQISAKSRMKGGWPARLRMVSQATITSYMPRPYRPVPTLRSMSLTKRWTSSSGAAQAKEPCSSAM